MAKQTTAKATALEVEEQPQTVTTERKPMTLAAKLLHIKASIGKIGKDGSSIVGGKTAPAKTVKYATLPSILERIMPLLDHEGIDYTVSPVMSDAAISMMAQGIRIFSIHFTDVATGEVSEPICYPFMRASNPEPIKADGSTITYATRYLLGLALGLQTEEDPDAKMQQSGQPQPRNQQPQQPTAPTDAERRAINAYIEGVDFAKAAEEVKKLQTKYPSYDFGKMIEVASTLKKTFTEFGELVSAGLWEKAEETLTAVKMANPKSKFAVWEKKLSDAKTASATADTNTTATF
ncbi:MAG: ERF family protein [Bacteroidales bacterium]|nr:ERF family protein [Bacteroidales bacterium]